MAESSPTETLAAIEEADWSAVVLLVDDQPMVGEAIRRMLADQSGMAFHYCSDAAAAVDVAQRIRPTVILQDLIMPGVDGLTLVDRYRANPATKDISIIVLSSKEDPAIKRDAFQGGANDYLVKLPDKIELVARIRLHSKAYLNQMALAQRIEELQAVRDELARLVSTDVLTGLCSRRRWLEVAAAELSRSRRYGRPLAILMADLDFFKRVNDTFGHDVGDQVLEKFAGVLATTCRQSDVAGRMGGEEFAVLLPETPIEGAAQVAQRIVETCRSIEMPTGAGHLTFTCSLGAAEAGSGDKTIEAVLRRADMALYEAKRSGRDGWKCSAGHREETTRSSANPL